MAVLDIGRGMGKLRRNVKVLESKNYTTSEKRADHSCFMIASHVHDVRMGFSSSFQRSNENCRLLSFASINRISENERCFRREKGQSDENTVRRLWLGKLKCGEIIFSKIIKGDFRELCSPGFEFRQFDERLTVQHTRRSEIRFVLLHRRDGVALVFENDQERQSRTVFKRLCVLRTPLQFQAVLRVSLRFLCVGVSSRRI